MFDLIITRMASACKCATVKGEQHLLLIGEAQQATTLLLCIDIVCLLYVKF